MSGRRPALIVLLVGTVGFEPTISCSQSRCADQAAPRPVQTAADLRFPLLDGLEAAGITLQHHLTGVLRSQGYPTWPAPSSGSFGAGNKSDRTVETYLEAVRLLEAFLARRGVGLAKADRAHIEAFSRRPGTHRRISPCYLDQASEPSASATCCRRRGRRPARPAGQGVDEAGQAALHGDLSVGSGGAAPLGLLGRDGR
jgi:hypothetical protein